MEKTVCTELKKDIFFHPFFAKVWYPLHDRNEPSRVYRKIVSELDVKLKTGCEGGLHIMRIIGAKKF
jgi:hypothetical protein